MEIIIIIALILLNGIFAMSEIAMISARKSNLDTQARQGNTAAKRALKLAKDPDKFLSTIQIGITLIGILTGIYSGDTLAAKFGAALADIGIPLSTATTIAQIVIVVIVTYLTLIFGELVPKRIGMNAAENVAKIVSGPMKALSTIASPFVWILSRSTVGITRLLKLKEGGAKDTEDEIRSIIREGAESGEVQEVEQQIVGRVFSLGDRTVGSIMTHRNDVVWIDRSMSPDQIRQLVNEHPHNRYPVAEGNIDRLSGIVLLKDIFAHLNDPDFSLDKIMHPAKFFHEGMEVYNALERLRRDQIDYGVICDEFGVTQGIFTLRDILEALVGSMPEEREEPEIIQRKDGSCLVDGQCPFYDFLAYFGLEQTYAPGQYNTVSGLLLDKLEHIPASGESITWNEFTLEVVDMDGARIDKILVTRHPMPAEE